VCGNKGWALLLGQDRALRVTPKADKAAGTWSVWIPFTLTARRMYAPIALYNPNGAHRAGASTPERQVASARQRGRACIQLLLLRRRPPIRSTPRGADIGRG